MEERPLVTFGLLGFNQERYIQAGVQAALAQTYSPLQIILSDDRSTDGTWETMKAAAAAYQGPHELVLNQNLVNQGLGAHVNTLMSLARGELIVIAAGDDISRADRVGKVVDTWNRSGHKALSLTSHFIKIDGNGTKIGEFRAKFNPASRDLLFRARHGCWNVQGCAHAWHRKVFEVFGPLQSSVVAEDRAIEFRSLALGDIAIIDEYLVQYRMHDSNLAAISDTANRAARLRNSITVNKINFVMFQQFLADLDRIQTLKLSSDMEILQAQKLICSNLSRLTMERGYLGGSRTHKLLCAIKAFFQISPKTGVKWMLKFAR